MDKPKANRMTKEDFLKLKEEDVMLITNPGRMGDEDGSTFIIKKGNEYTIYRVDGWMYPHPGETITMEEMAKQFPQWYESWEHSNEKDYQGKYQHLYMGFGNGLGIDHSIYPEYEPYLKAVIEEYLQDKKEEEKESLQYAAIFQGWEEAFLKMAKEKQLILTNKN